MDSAILTQSKQAASTPVQEMSQAASQTEPVLRPSNDVAPLSSDIKLNLSDLTFSLSSEEQAVLDRILDFLNQSALMPVFEVSGDLISLTLELNERLLAMMPEMLQEDARIVMQAITNALCDYADASGFTGFTLAMEFRK